MEHVWFSSVFYLQSTSRLRELGLREYATRLAYSQNMAKNKDSNTPLEWRIHW